jgi:hypothetical protein
MARKVPKRKSNRLNEKVIEVNPSGKEGSLLIVIHKYLVLELIDL